MVISQFTQRWTPGLREFLNIITELDLPSNTSRSALSYYIERLTEQRNMINAIDHNNEDMVLLLLDNRKPTDPYSFALPELLQLLCTDDRNSMILYRVLNWVEPKQALHMITERTCYSWLTPLDVALVSRSTECLRILGEFLVPMVQETAGKEKVSALIAGMIRASAYVQLGRELVENVWKLFWRIISPFTFPTFVIQLAGNLTRPCDLNVSPKQLYFIIQVAHQLGCEMIPGYGDVGILSQR
ncbi:uncharacterized protein FTOL_13957 [Fusarium torulosum]|uniref:Uncharacterized protein n=1 Tax=Fusarium torulosum TaxID=33205 RepID=A0AAE8MPH9_9HYPO|nr:uncharacterized protein FTOL_13957 [Fusarium torulosum]